MLFASRNNHGGFPHHGRRYGLWHPIIPLRLQQERALRLRIQRLNGNGPESAVIEFLLCQSRIRSARTNPYVLQSFPFCRRGQKPIHGRAAVIIGRANLEALHGLMLRPCFLDLLPQHHAGNPVGRPRKNRYRLLSSQFIRKSGKH